MDDDVFIAEFDKDGVLSWSTFLGGELRDKVLSSSSIAIIENKIALMGGSEDLNTLPANLGGGYQQNLSERGYFIAEFANRTLNWKTDFGCIDEQININDLSQSIDYDGNGNLLIIGTTDCEMPVQSSEYCEPPTQQGLFPLCPPPGGIFGAEMYKETYIDTKVKILVWRQSGSKPYLSFDWGDGSPLDTARLTYTTLLGYYEGDFYYLDRYEARHMYDTAGAYRLGFRDSFLVEGIVNIEGSGNKTMELYDTLVIYPVGEYLGANRYAVGINVREERAYIEDGILDTALLSTTMRAMTILITEDLIVSAGPDVGLPGIASIYPNPASDLLNIGCMLPGNSGRIRILNEAGQLMYSTEIAPSSQVQRFSLSVERWPAGSYIACFDTGQVIATRRFVVIRGR
ncbi:MAG: T9SS type A sorting domain-containing protein [Phaeodactylibacter sp.]|nr:T9SS type A sorting domain-containing protein [Phaeodactylibacter sp.]